MAQYVAITTVNAQQSGWDVLARGTDKDAVRQEAWDSIVGSDIYADTYRKNLTVLSLTKARRVAGRCALGECEHDHGYE
jgi:hypothetical protein